MSGEESARPTAQTIYERVKSDASDELARPLIGLAFSALLAGATMGFSGLVVSAALADLPHRPSAHLIAALFYPLGFIVVIVGRGQLFTENTLYPVTLVLDERRHLLATLRLWVVVFAANVAGALIFAVLVNTTEAIPGDVGHEFARLGVDAAHGAAVTNFWSGVVAGWLLALLAWAVEATDIAVGQIMVIWAVTFVIGLVGFDHSVATTAEVLVGVVHGSVGIPHAIGWLAVVVAGNVVGGVGIVSLLQYGQVRAG